MAHIDSVTTSQKRDMAVSPMDSRVGGEAENYHRHKNTAVLHNSSGQNESSVHIRDETLASISNINSSSHE